MAQPDPEPHLEVQIPAPPLVESQNVSTPFGMTSAPLPTPSPVPTAPPLELHNVGRHVESVTMTGHPVHNVGAEQLGVLHIGEAIRYSDGTLDIVGYFPVGSSPLGNGDPMFVERYEQDPTKNSAQTPEQYVAEAKQHFTLPVYPIPGQTLDQLVATQAETWKAYNASHGPPRYDFSGTMLHNSNGAMVGSLIESGRPDVARTLMNSLEPPQLMRAREAAGLSPEAAADSLALDRKLAGLPSSPGASNPLVGAQAHGLATSEPDSAIKGELPGQLGGAGAGIFFDAGEQVIRGATSARDGLVHGFEQAGNTAGRTLAGAEHGVGDAVHNAAFPSRSGYIDFTRTDRNGDHQEKHTTPFQQGGRILYADNNVVVQSVRGQETITYPTQALLGENVNSSAMHDLRQAAAQNAYVEVRVGQNGIDAATLHQSLQQQTPAHQAHQMGLGGRN